MTALTRKTFRVRFCEWHTFAIDISARDAQQVVELAQTLRNEHGDEPFEEIDGATEAWEAEEVCA
jgi:hypothetical protein